MEGKKGNNFFFSKLSKNVQNTKASSRGWQGVGSESVKAAILAQQDQLIDQVSTKSQRKVNEKSTEGE